MLLTRRQTQIGEIAKDQLECSTQNSCQVTADIFNGIRNADWVIINIVFFARSGCVGDAWK